MSGQQTVCEMGHELNSCFSSMYSVVVQVERFGWYAEAEVLSIPELACRLARHLLLTKRPYILENGQWSDWIAMRAELLIIASRPCTAFGKGNGQSALSAAGARRELRYRGRPLLLQGR
jgi:hypothetical protein